MPIQHSQAVLGSHSSLLTRRIAEQLESTLHSQTRELVEYGFGVLAQTVPGPTDCQLAARSMLGRINDPGCDTSGLALTRIKLTL